MFVLCTGGLGYIGSHTVLKLLDSGFKVHVLDNLCNSSLVVLERLESISGKKISFSNVDLNDKSGLQDVFKSNKFTAVIHFAALKAVGESVSHPLLYFRNNVAGTITLLEVMQEYGVKTLVFSSSATVYAPSAIPLVETDPLQPSNPYGRTKLMMEQILQDLASADKEWRIELLRYFNPVGAHSSGRIGEAPQGCPNNLMPYIQQVAVGRRSHLNVFGDDYLDSPDGTGVRDYVHVEDLARAHVLALGCLVEGEEEGTGSCSIHNLGTGRGFSVLEMIKAFERASGKEVPFRVEGRRPGDLGVVICNPERAERDFGWRAEKSLEDMMIDSWKWQSMNLYGYREEGE